MRKTKFIPLSVGILGLLLCNGCLKSDLPTSTTPAVERGPKILAFDGDANGLWWDEKGKTLYIADENNRILKWTDSGSFALFKDLPSTSTLSRNLGQLVQTANGALLVTRFGHGTAGDVVSISASGEATVIPDLDPLRRRIGLTVTQDGRLFDSWFVFLASSGTRVGSVGKLGLDGSESEVITGLKKPVGVLAVGDTLYVSDQDLGRILKAPLSNPANFTVFATLATPDLLCAGPAGTFFSGNTTGNLYRINASGETSKFKSGFQQVRGVAYDSTNHRLFVADHDGDATDGMTNFVHILPVD